MKKDTSAWIMQTWIAFGISFVGALYGLYQLKIDFWIKAFLLFGVINTVSSSFTLAKTIRDNLNMKKDTNAWIMQTWIIFIINSLLVVFGLFNIDGDFAIKGFIGISFLFLLSSSFTLAKTIRDNQFDNGQIN
jgi:hypothetical protein